MIDFKLFAVGLTLISACSLDAERKERPVVRPPYTCLFKCVQLEPVLVSGKIAHKRGVPFTNDGDFEFTPESHAYIRILYTEGADTASKIVYERRVENLTQLPLEFSITGYASEVFKEKGEYSISVRVFSQAGEEGHVGDLINEHQIVIQGQTLDLTIDVTGLEACGSEGGGGFCH